MGAERTIVERRYPLFRTTPRGPSASPPWIYPAKPGQDSEQIAKIAPMAMIFVPSRDGISHSPKEFTSWRDVANGAEVLYRTVLLLDDRLNRN